MSLTWNAENDGIGAKVPARPLDIGLWAPPAPPCPPKALRATTSLEAHRKAVGKAGSQKAHILMLVRYFTITGRTRKEVAADTGYLRDSVNGRVRELVAANLVHERGVRDGEKVIFYGAKP